MASLFIFEMFKLVPKDKEIAGHIFKHMTLDISILVDTNGYSDKNRILVRFKPNEIKNGNIYQLDYLFFYNLRNKTYEFQCRIVNIKFHEVCWSIFFEEDEVNQNQDETYLVLKHGRKITDEFINSEVRLDENKSKIFETTNILLDKLKNISPS